MEAATQVQPPAAGQTGTAPRRILALDHASGGGFTASESRDGGKSWFFRGDVGAQSRAAWRRLARREGLVLREVRL